jgi:hypothetical protein
MPPYTPPSLSTLNTPQIAPVQTFLTRSQPSNQNQQNNTYNPQPRQNPQNHPNQTKFTPPQTQKKAAGAIPGCFSCLKRYASNHPNPQNTSRMKW